MLQYIYIYMNVYTRAVYTVYIYMSMLFRWGDCIISIIRFFYLDSSRQKRQRRGQRRFFEVARTGSNLLFHWNNGTDKSTELYRCSIISSNKWMSLSFLKNIQWFPYFLRNWDDHLCWACKIVPVHCHVSLYTVVKVDGATPKFGGLVTVRGHDKLILGSCAIYLPCRWYKYV